jgi:hypothetical protein
LPWKGLAVAALVATSAAATFWLCRGLRHDDAFITFVYARHLGAGEGFVFNLGERVLGATSPLHVLLLALVYLVTGDVLPTAAIALAPLPCRCKGSCCTRWRGDCDDGRAPRGRKPAELRDRFHWGTGTQQRDRNMARMSRFSGWQESIFRKRRHEGADCAVKGS